MATAIARVNNVVITMETTRDGERSFALRYVLDPKEPQGVLAIQRLLTKERFREIAAAFREAVEYLDQS